MVSADKNVLFCFLLSYLCCVSRAQFPTACVQNVTRNVSGGDVVEAQELTSVCCPEDCGVGEGRGECTRPPTPKYNLDLVKAEVAGNHLCHISDVRLLWPSAFNFTRTCTCKNNWAGPACSRCAFGYSVTTLSNGTRVCTKSANRIKRKSTLRLSDAEWKTYTDTLLKAAVTPSNYSVLIGTFADRDNWRFVPVTIYDFFVWLHYFASKDNSNETPTCDYAHESSGFLTWHRWYLLVVESMLREVNPAFFIPYWEWTNENSTRDLYSETHLGTALTWEDIKDQYPSAYGSARCGIDDAILNAQNGPFANWKTMCTNLTDAVNGFNCDPNNPEQRRPLQRCLGCCQVDDCCHDGGTNSSGREPSILPHASHVAYALEASVFDSSEWTTETLTESFRNRLEGFAQPVPPYAANHDQHYVHNQVHIFVGGTEVPLSPNSPYFWLHHGMIDYVFEKWISKHSGSPFRPTAAEADAKPIAHPGQNPEEYIVPFFPTVTHLDAFRPAYEFGYEYEEASLEYAPAETPPNEITTPSTTTSPAKKPDTFSLMLLLLLGIVGVVKMKE